MSAVDAAMRKQVMLNQFVFVAGCQHDQAEQLLTESNWQFEAALSRFFQESAPLCRTNSSSCHYPVCTPANTPVTPPNFPDALAALAKMRASDPIVATASPVLMLSAPVTASPSLTTSPNAASSHSSAINVISRGH